MRILLATGNSALRAAVAEALEGQDHELRVETDGLRALAAFRTWTPDLLLTEVDLAELSGLELCRLLRLASWHRFTPVLAFADESAQARLSLLEAGVLYILPFPFDPAELRLLVHTQARQLRLQNELLRRQGQEDEELHLVKHMLRRMARMDDPAASPEFHMEVVQTRRINGDACIYRESIPGVHFGLICDATGHGLMAGVSTIPVMETFLGMVNRDLPLSTIYQEIHTKLKNLLPTGRFACLLLLRVDVANGVLSVLNAGMPDVLLLRRSGEVQSFPSRVLPAGIAGADPGVVVSEAGIATGDRILACSDGLADLTSATELAQRYLIQGADLSHGEHCAAIRRLVAAAVGKGIARDDISWALWQVPEPAPGWVRSEAGSSPAEGLVTGLEASFTLDPRIHAPRELLPQVLSLVMGLQVSHALAQLFGMLLTEALTNAVEHGLLNLDSNIKAQGFEAYEQHRRAALEALDGGSVRFTLGFLHDPVAADGRVRRIRVEVEDSGPGFDWSAWPQPRDPGDLRPFGRGIALLNALGQDLRFNERGNRVSFSLECP